MPKNSIDQKLKALGAGTCANSDRVPAGPNSTTAEVAAAKNAAHGDDASDMGAFDRPQGPEHPRGKPIGFCPQTDGATTVPVADGVPLATRISAASSSRRRRTQRKAWRSRSFTLRTRTTCRRRCSRRRNATALTRRRRRHRARTAHRLRRQVHQRTHRLPLGRHRHPHRDENGRERVPQGEPRGAESRTERGNRQVGRARDERAGPAGIGDPHAPERGR